MSNARNGYSFNDIKQRYVLEIIISELKNGRLTHIWKLSIVYIIHFIQRWIRPNPRAVLNIDKSKQTVSCTRSPNYPIHNNLQHIICATLACVYTAGKANISVADVSSHLLCTCGIIIALYSKWNFAYCTCGLNLKISDPSAIKNKKIFANG